MSKYCIVFDTNVLFREYDRYADFTRFSFSATLNTFIDEIEQRDIYDLVSILIPSVVWEEAKKQNLDAYKSKLEEIEKKHNSFKFPFHSLICQNDDYECFLNIKIREYKKELNTRLTKINILPLPKNSCFHKIIHRAYEKRPPFEAQGKKSDKGFKDVILWESILLYKHNHPNVNIILYTNDKMFNEELREEYKKEFNGEEIIFISDKTELELKNKLSEIALEKDDTFPVPEEDELSRLKQYLYSDKFTEDIKEFEKKIIGDTEYLHIIGTEVINLDTIDEPIQETDFISEYTVFATYKIKIKPKDQEPFEDEKYIALNISCTNGTHFQLLDLDKIETENYEPNDSEREYNDK